MPEKQITIEDTIELLKGQIVLQVAKDLQAEGNTHAAVAVLAWLDKNTMQKLPYER